MDPDEMFELFKFGVSGHYLGILAHGGGRDKRIGISNGVFGFDFCGMEDKVVGARNCPDGQEPYSVQNLAGKLDVLEPCTAIKDLTEVDDVHKDLSLTALRPVQEVFYNLGPLFILDPGQNREGIK